MEKRPSVLARHDAADDARLRIARVEHRPQATHHRVGLDVANLRRRKRAVDVRLRLIGEHLVRSLLTQQGLERPLRLHIRSGVHPVPRHRIGAVTGTVSLEIGGPLPFRLVTEHHDLASATHELVEHVLAKAGDRIRGGGHDGDFRHRAPFPVFNTPKVFNIILRSSTRLLFSM